MQTFKAFVRRKFNEKPRLKQYYGSFERYLENYQKTHGLTPWLESLRSSKPSLGFVNSIARTYIADFGFEPKIIHQVLVELYRRYDIEIPAVEGILTPDYWVNKAAQMHWVSNQTAQVA